MKKYTFVPESLLISIRLWAIATTFTTIVFCILFLYMLNEWNRLLHNMGNI